MDKKDFKKFIKELLKEKGYISIKTNKFVILPLFFAHSA